MSAPNHKPQSLNPWKTFLGVLCMALVLFSGTLSVTHSHQHDVDTHGTCNLCITAHSVAQISQAPAEILIAQVFEIVEPGFPVARPRTVSITRHFTRPPPDCIRS